MGSAGGCSDNGIAFWMSNGIAEARTGKMACRGWGWGCGVEDAGT